MNERDIFLTALQETDPGERTAYLDRACGDDAALRRRVETLLYAHAIAGSFLEHPALAQVATPRPQEYTQPVADDQVPLDFLQSGERAGSLGRLGRHEVLEVVGRGGMGVVLRARDSKLLRVVAIKVLAAPLAASGTARQRFVREARAAAAIRDEHVIAIHAVED
jgi:eukaryotic-like serine/threonine-protein kinase